MIFSALLAVGGFSDSWQVVFSTASNIVVVVLLFARKHTQNRELTALQLKLDELIRAIPPADDHVVQSEHADENEIGARKRQQITVHETLRTRGGTRESESKTE